MFVVLQDNFTALHFAARKGQVEIVTLLLNENSPSVEINAVTKVWAASLLTRAVFLALEFDFSSAGARARSCALVSRCD